MGVETRSHVDSCPFVSRLDGFFHSERESIGWGCRNLPSSLCEYVFVMDLPTCTDLQVMLHRFDEGFSKTYYYFQCCVEAREMRSTQQGQQKSKGH